MYVEGGTSSHRFTSGLTPETRAKPPNPLVFPPRDQVWVPSGSSTMWGMSSPNRALDILLVQTSGASWM